MASNWFLSLQWLLAPDSHAFVFKLDTVGRLMETLTCTNPTPPTRLSCLMVCHPNPLPLRHAGTAGTPCPRIRGPLCLERSPSLFLGWERSPSKSSFSGHLPRYPRPSGRIYNGSSLHSLVLSYPIYAVSWFPFGAFMNHTCQEHSSPCICHWCAPSLT